ncbi:MAG: alkaline phosphatase D family protein [Cyclobacteriaceae bacterium]
MADPLLLGPILKFQGLKQGQWHTSALVVIRRFSSPPSLRLMHHAENILPAATKIFTHDNLYTVWRIDWAVRLREKAQAIAYQVNEQQTHYYQVPGLQELYRLAYGSCFGTHKNILDFSGRDNMWKMMQQSHEKDPFHLILMGGDQLYADALWKEVPLLKKWKSLPKKKRLQAIFSGEMEQEVEQFYFFIYLKIWSRQLPARMLSRIPTLMMWDDHDIFDGWGSYPEELVCEVFKGVFRVAQKYFRIFQQQLGPKETPGDAYLLPERGFTFAYRLGDLAILALDTRSERSQQQIMSRQSWHAVKSWMNAHLPEKTLPDGTKQQACRQLLIMSSIPVVYLNVGFIEKILHFLPGHQSMEDDFIDQWMSRNHRDERFETVQDLFEFSSKSNCRVSLLSGDVHVGCHGSFEESAGGKQKIYQLVSSAMVNLPPPSFLVYIMDKILGKGTDKVGTGIKASLLKFPESGCRIIGRRNFLSLSLDEQRSLRAEWFVDGQKRTFFKNIPALVSKT